MNTIFNKPTKIFGSPAYMHTAKFCAKVVFAPMPKFRVAQLSSATIATKIKMIRAAA